MFECFAITPFAKLVKHIITNQYADVGKKLFIMVEYFKTS